MVLLHQDAIPNKRFSMGQLHEKAFSPSLVPVHHRLGGTRQAYLFVIPMKCTNSFLFRPPGPIGFERIRIVKNVHKLFSGFKLRSLLFSSALFRRTFGTAGWSSHRRELYQILPFLTSPAEFINCATPVQRRATVCLGWHGFICIVRR